MFDVSQQFFLERDGHLHCPTIGWNKRMGERFVPVHTKIIHANFLVFLLYLQDHSLKSGIANMAT